MTSAPYAYPMSVLTGLILVCAGVVSGAAPPQVLPGRSIGSKSAAGYAAAVIVEDGALAHTSQQFPLARGRLTGAPDAVAQVEQALDNLAVALRPAQSGLERAVRINAYVTDGRHIPALRRGLARRFPGAYQPALSIVESTLPVPGAVVAMDVVAVSDSTPPAGAVNLFRAGELGGSSLAAHVAVLPPGRKVFVSGQAEKGPLAEATTKTLQGLETTLTYLKLTRTHIVQIKCFLQPMSDIAAVERGIRAFFPVGPVPPVVFVEWTSTAPIEIELIAAGGPSQPGEPAVEFITPPPFKASPVYAKVVRVNGGSLLYTSGLHGPAFADATTQVREAFTNLRQLVVEAGGDMQHLAKATYYVTTDEVSHKLGELRPDYYDPQRPPSASKSAARGVGIEGCQFMMDMIGVVPSNR